jgi:hypothetical protein
MHPDFLGCVAIFSLNFFLTYLLSLPGENHCCQILRSCLTAVNNIESALGHVLIGVTDMGKDEVGPVGGRSQIILAKMLRISFLFFLLNPLSIMGRQKKMTSRDQITLEDAQWHYLGRLETAKIRGSDEQGEFKSRKGL